MKNVPKLKQFDLIYFMCISKYAKPKFFAIVNFGIYPAYLLYHMSIAYIKEEMDTPPYRKRFGDFYVMFEPRYWWWYMTWGRSIFLRFGVPILKLLRLGLYSSDTEFSKNRVMLCYNLAICCSEK